MSIAPCYAKFGLVLVVACCPEMLAAYAWLFRPACEALLRGGIRVSRRDYPVDVVRSVRRFEGVKLVALTHPTFSGRESALANTKATKTSSREASDPDAARTASAISFGRISLPPIRCVGCRIHTTSL